MLRRWPADTHHRAHDRVCSHLLKLFYQLCLLLKVVSLLLVLALILKRDFVDICMLKTPHIIDLFLHHLVVFHR